MIIGNDVKSFHKNDVLGTARNSFTNAHKTCVYLQACHLQSLFFKLTALGTVIVIFMNRPLSWS